MYPAAPKHPERICWGCSKLCPAHDMACGNEVVRAQHPCELFGDDWRERTDAPAEVSAADRDASGIAAAPR